MKGRRDGSLGPIRKAGKDLVYRPKSLTSLSSRKRSVEIASSRM
jgi:hypothetical protein